MPLDSRLAPFHPTGNSAFIFGPLFTGHDATCRAVLPDRSCATLPTLMGACLDSIELWAMGFCIAADAEL
ncbi:hypothetical protein M404DRAFT_1003957 [Pisolithus tinctorius Marx 270]|uniref:Uncharacterized protein n=1 Tax=Pisolithus tinctorius Marx 270 TaxID=870435 RepID=A0A0C3NY79_PISTI|nr:hypothetical protein M404DRAFT_1003957 [Pisolithus tinctorius Marx 270]